MAAQGDPLAPLQVPALQVGLGFMIHMNLRKNRVKLSFEKKIERKKTEGKRDFEPENLVR